MHNNLLQVPKTLRSTIKLSLISLLIIAVTLISTPSKARINQINPMQVGYISLLIGDTRANGPNRKATERLETGSPIYLGDVITTRASGHAHLHFVDGALMSLRPQSRLTIQEYNYDEKVSENNRVSFKLEEGIARSISGKAAKKARENFRMSTPVAAIGVRGTDFIVHTSQDRTRALVTEGGIVLSGLETSCPNFICDILVLNSGSEQLLELTLLDNEPRLMRTGYNEMLTSTVLNSDLALIEVKNLATDSLASNIQSEEMQPTTLAQSPTVESPQVLVETSSTNKTVSDTASEKLISTELETDLPMVIAKKSEETSADQTQAGTADTTQENAEISQENTDTNTSLENIEEEIAATETTPETSQEKTTNKNELIDQSDLLITLEKPEVEALTVETALVWGYLNTNNDTQPDYVQHLSAIEEHSDSYQNTHIKNQAYALYRRNETGQIYNAKVPELQFNLNNASAWLNWEATRESMQVSNGSLSIDFENGNYSTVLQLEHERTGPIIFSSKGSTSRTGRFTGDDTDNQSLKGIVSFDNKEAAYLFNKKLPSNSSVIDGITHWGVKE